MPCAQYPCSCSQPVCVLQDLPDLHSGDVPDERGGEEKRGEWRGRGLSEIGNRKGGREKGERRGKGRGGEETRGGESREGGEGRVGREGIE